MRLAYGLFEGTGPGKCLYRKDGLARIEIDSPTVSGGFWDKIREVLQKLSPDTTMGGIAENLPFWCVGADPAKTLLVYAI